jgi:predicted ATP-grasp superfamily ATP-dependent carboligase
MGNRLLLTDGSYKNSLAILWSLKNEYKTDIVTQSRLSANQCWYSRYRNNVIRMNEHEHIDSYGKSMLNIVKMNGYDFLIPVGLKSCLAVSQNKKMFLESTKVLAPDWESMKLAYDKGATMRLARSLGIPMPWTYDVEITGIDEIPAYPVVLKVQDEKGSFVKYCNDRSELETNLRFLKQEGREGPIVQELIKGSGYGFYAVYKNGVMFDFYMMKRVHEMPITGGPGSFAVSVKDKLLFDTAKKITDSMNWDGPIMVEFKLDPADGLFKLIEINPKLWGSLGITIAAGIDIPRIIIGILNGEINKPTSSRFEEARYDDISFRWTFPDEFSRLMSNFSIKEAINFLKCKPDLTNMNLNDPLPTIYNITSGLVSGARLLVDENLRYPHGVISKNIV